MIIMQLIMITMQLIIMTMIILMIRIMIIIGGRRGDGGAGAPHERRARAERAAEQPPEAGGHF